MAIDDDLEIEDAVRSQPPSEDEQAMETQQEFATQMPPSNVFNVNLHASAPTALMGPSQLQRALKKQSSMLSKKERATSRTTTIPRPEPLGSEEATSKPNLHLEEGGENIQIPAEGLHVSPEITASTPWQTLSVTALGDQKLGGSEANPGIRPLYRSATPTENNVTTRNQNGDIGPETAAHDPWRGMRRIRRRDVMIPKDQEKLLNDADCWIPVEPGKRTPVGRIPIKLLEKLNQKAERRARVSLPVDENKGVVAGHELELGKRPKGDEDDPQSSVPAESDDEVSSEISWQATPPPPPRGLPPDSSQEGSTTRSPRERLPREDEPSVVRDEDVQRVSLTKRQVFDATGESSFGGLSSTSPSHAPAILSSNIETEVMEGESQLNGAMADPGPSQFVTREEFSQLDGTFVDVGEEKSDLETMIPHALGDKPDQEEIWSDHLPSPEAPLPSTAVTNDAKSVLQVKRTPYLPRENSHRSLSRHNSCASWKEAGSPGLHGEEHDDVGTLSSDPVIPATFVPEQSSSAEVENSITSALPALQPSICDESTQFDQQLHSSIEESFQGNSEETATERRLNRALTNSPEAIGRIKANHGDADVSREAVLTDQKAPSGSKSRPSRSGTESGPSPSKPAKRKRHFRPPVSFNFSQEKRDVQNPALLNKMHKREFLNKPLKPDPAAPPQQHINSTSTRVDPIIQAIQEANEEVVKAMRDYNPRKRPLREQAQNGKSVERPRSSRQPARQTPEPPNTDGKNVGDSARPETSFTDGPPTEMDECRRESKRRRAPSGEATSAETSVPYPAPTFTPSSHKSEEPKVEQQQDSAAKPLPLQRPEDPRSDTDTIFERFRETYPQYPGTLQNFVSACVYIEWLVESKSMVHRSLWDDFIFRQATEYSTWAEERSSRGEAFTSFEDYYNDEVEEPICTRGVINPKSLESAIRLDTAAAGKMRYHAIPQIKALIMGAARPLDVGPRTPVTGFTPARQASAATSLPEMPRDLAREATDPRGVQGPGLPKGPVKETDSSRRDKETIVAIKHGDRDETSVDHEEKSKTVEPPDIQTSTEAGGGAPCSHVQDQQRTTSSIATSPELGSPRHIRKRLPLMNDPPAKEKALRHPQDKALLDSSARGHPEVTKPRQPSSSLSGSSKPETSPSAPPTRLTKRSSECSEATIRQLQAAASRACSRTISPPPLQRRATAGSTARVKESSDGGNKGEETAGAVSRPSTTAEAAWWQDVNSPFKQFTRSYVRLKSVQGTMGSVDEANGTIVPPPPKKLDFLTWTL